MSAHGLLVRAQLFFVAPTGAQQLYYLHPDVSFFKGNGFKQIGPYLDMPANSAAGDVSYPSALLVALCPCLREFAVSGEWAGGQEFAGLVQPTCSRAVSVRTRVRVICEGWHVGLGG